MQTLPSNQPPTGAEKILRWLPFIAAGVATFWFWGTISQFVVNTLKNTLETLIYGGILAAIVLFVWSNPGFLWMTYKKICRAIVSAFIKMDPLSYMDRYADLLTEKLANVRKSLINLKAEKVKLDRKIAEDTKTMNDNLKLGAAAASMNPPNKAKKAMYGTLAQGASDSIALYTPNLRRLERSIEFLTALDENWDSSIVTMRATIERKRSEWQTLKENAKALNQAAEFLRGDTEEGRIFKESIKALEQQVSQKIAFIEDFEQRAKPIMEGAALEKAVHEGEGVDMIDKYMNDSRIFLTDLDAETIPYESVQQPVLIKAGRNKFNL